MYLSGNTNSNIISALTIIADIGDINNITNMIMLAKQAIVFCELLHCSIGLTKSDGLIASV